MRIGKVEALYTAWTDLGELEVSSVDGSYEDGVDLLILENLVESRDDLDAREELASVRSLRGSFTLEDGVELVVVGEGEDEGDVENAVQKKEGRRRKEDEVSLSLTGKRERARTHVADMPIPITATRMGEDIG